MKRTQLSTWADIERLCVCIAVVAGGNYLLFLFLFCIYKFAAWSVRRSIGHGRGFYAFSTNELTRECERDHFDFHGRSIRALIEPCVMPSYFKPWHITICSSLVYFITLWILSFYFPCPLFWCFPQFSHLRNHCHWLRQLEPKSNQWRRNVNEHPFGKLFYFPLEWKALKNAWRLRLTPWCASCIKITQRKLSLEFSVDVRMSRNDDKYPRLQ